MSQEVLKPPPEILYARELEALARWDSGPRPPGWKLSPRAVKAFLCGHEQLQVTRKFYGDDFLVERAVIGLAGNRGLLLIGEPGTAKSMLSELLTAAISGNSTYTIQGTAGTTEDQIKYSWNYALLLAEGPSTRALVPAPIYHGMKEGMVVRFEELTRCPSEVQDSLVSLLSDKILVVPELSGPDRVVLARPGFNLIATANTRDRGVHEMSSALKRRFNFETVHPIRDLDQEVRLVTDECQRLLEAAHVEVALEVPIIQLLVTAFQDLRQGVSAEGIQVERPSAVMSTAEAVSVAFSAGLDAYYYGSRRLTPEVIARHLAGAVLKDNAQDIKKLRHYFDVVVTQRSQQEGAGPWAELLAARKFLPRT